VQIASNVVGHEFAAKLIQSLDDYRDTKEATVKLRRVQKIAELSKNPKAVLGNHALTHFEQGDVAAAAALKLLSDTVSGKGRGIEQDETIHAWLTEAVKHNEWTSVQIYSWIVESAQRGSTSRRYSPEIFYANCELSFRLSWVIAKNPTGGITPIPYSNFAALSMKFQEFLPGEANKAQSWLESWLRENVKSYLQIVDPYFELQHIRYFNYVPEDCLVVVVTTNKGFPNDISAQEIQRYWQAEVSTRPHPFIQILIVPSSFENRFHDRAILTEEAGLNIFGSLSTFGKSKTKIEVLSIEGVDALKGYVQRMLDSTNWLLTERVRPTTIIVNSDRAFS
jgi:hypothetical protein